MSTPTPSTSRARLALSRLAIHNYRSLRDVRWPEDGLGWEGRIPETVLVGGVNGSGKTTLLDVLFGVVAFVIGWEASEKTEVKASDLMPPGTGRIELDLDAGEGNRGVGAIRLAIEGSLDEPIRLHTRAGTLLAPVQPDMVMLVRKVLAEMCRKADGPRLLYFPTDRAVPIPSTRFKRPGSNEIDESPIYRYAAPAEWEQSVEAVLYDARWRDLNAKEQGDPAAAKNFAAYEDALKEFFGGTKRFVWDRDGVLHVETKDGARHPLESLSSGEKQVLLFVAELFRRWTPGSLVLLDEPELHLHESWIAALWGALRRLQRERGGQVIVTTQSNYLFGLGGAGSRVVLRGGSK
jgi:ABC-type transport system involved in cytochrome c biogenesis ATPase subunit